MNNKNPFWLVEAKNLEEKSPLKIITEKTFSGHNGYIYKALFFGTKIVTSGHDGLIKVFDYASEKLLNASKVHGNKYVNDLIKWKNDDDKKLFIASGEDGIVDMFDADDLEKSRKILFKAEEPVFQLMQITNSRYICCIGRGIYRRKIDCINSTLMSKDRKDLLSGLVPHRLSSIKKSKKYEGCFYFTTSNSDGYRLLLIDYENMIIRKEFYLDLAGIGWKYTLSITRNMDDDEIVFFGSNSAKSVHVTNATKNKYIGRIAVGFNPLSMLTFHNSQNPLDMFLLCGAYYKGSLKAMVIENNEVKILHKEKLFRQGLKYMKVLPFEVSNSLRILICSWEGSVKIVRIENIPKGTLPDSNVQSDLDLMERLLYLSDTYGEEFEEEDFVQLKGLKLFFGIRIKGLEEFRIIRSLF